MDAADDVIKSAHSAPLTFEELSSRRDNAMNPWDPLNSASDPWMALAGPPACLKDGDSVATLSLSGGSAASSCRSIEPGAHANLYVANVPTDWSEPHLASLFRLFGAVESCYIARCRRTGRSRGHGFVKFASVRDACLARDKTAGLAVDGRRLVVEFSRCTPEGGEGAAHTATAPCRSVYVKGLPGSWGMDEVVRLFATCGRVHSCRLLSQLSRESTAEVPVAAIVQMASVAEATHAVDALNGVVLPGAARPVVVRFARGGGKHVERPRATGQAAPGWPWPCPPGPLAPQMQGFATIAPGAAWPSAWPVAPLQPHLLQPQPHLLQPQPQPLQPHPQPLQPQPLPADVDFLVRQLAAALGAGLFGPSS